MKNIEKALILAVSATFLTSAPALAAKYEAESATLSGGATPGADNSASGSKFVNMNGGTITFPNVSVENAGKYELAITYRADNPKNNLIKVNGSTSQTLAFPATTSWSKAIAIVTLKKGNNSIAIDKDWGWISVDYIDITPYTPAPFSISPKPVTPNPTEGLVKLYAFLVENFEKKTISGIMTGDLGSHTLGDDFRKQDDVEEIYKRSGKYPALVGVDFLFASGPNAKSSWNMEYTTKAIDIAKGVWKAGGIPNFTWHWKDPLDKDDAFYTPGASNGTTTNFNFADAFVAGTTEWNTESAAYKGIINDVDFIADFFLDLQKDGVAGIFRPLHEAGGTWFWWSINSGKQFAALYRLVYDRMVNVKGVRNMVWVYNPSTDDVNGWDPGDSYYDVLGIDIYNKSGDNSSNAASFDGLKAKNRGKKILALTENGPIPDVAKMHELVDALVPHMEQQIHRPDSRRCMEKQHGGRPHFDPRQDAWLGQVCGQQFQLRPRHHPLEQGFDQQGAGSPPLGRPHTSLQPERTRSRQWIGIVWRAPPAPWLLRHQVNSDSQIPSGPLASGDLILLA